MRFGYRSELAGPHSVPVLRAIGHSTWRNNQRYQITGHLTLQDGRFYQVMEGVAEAVALLSASILSDPRHHNIVVEGYQALSERQYPDWRLIGFDDIMPMSDLNAIDIKSDPSSVHYLSSIQKEG
ncbi:MAG: BLUF domain-containing protein [Pseudomonadota bacterium]